MLLASVSYNLDHPIYTEAILRVKFSEVSTYQPTKGHICNKSK